MNPFDNPNQHAWQDWHDRQWGAGRFAEDDRTLEEASHTPPSGVPLRTSGADVRSSLDRTVGLTSRGGAPDPLPDSRRPAEPSED